MKDNNFNNRIEQVMKTAMENLHPLIDSNIVIGNKIVSGDTDIIPITKVTLGFIAGGGEYYSQLKEIRRDNEYPFSGGSGGGLSIKPIGFFVIKNGNVDLIKIESKGAIEKLIEAIPEVARFIDKNFSNDKK